MLPSDSLCNGEDVGSTFTIFVNKEQVSDVDYYARICKAYAMRNKYVVPHTCLKASYLSSNPFGVESNNLNRPIGKCNPAATFL